MQIIGINIDEKKLKELIVNHIKNILGDIELDENDIKIKTRSLQNYKSKWETADFSIKINHIL